MVNTDFDRTLLEQVKNAYKFFNRGIDGDTFAIWQRQLNGYGEKMLINAFAEAIGSTKFCPTPNDVLRFLPKNAQHLEPETAYAQVPKSENCGGWVTNQMLIAWGQPILPINEFQQHRKFIERYKTLIDACKANGVPPSYFYTGPSNPALKVDLTIKAYHAGMLPARSVVKAMLEHNRDTDPVYYLENTEEQGRVLGIERKYVKTIIRKLYDDETAQLEHQSRPTLIKKDDEHE